MRFLILLLVVITGFFALPRHKAFACFDKALDYAAAVCGGYGCFNESTILRACVGQKTFASIKNVCLHTVRMKVPGIEEWRDVPTGCAFEDFGRD